MPRRYRKHAGTNDRLCRYELGEITADQVDIARKRAAIHLRNIHMVDYSLTHLVVDVYLQGARDMAEAIIARPLVLGNAGRREDDGYDYQRETGE